MKTPAEEYLETKQAFSASGVWNKVRDPVIGAAAGAAVTTGAAGLGVGAQKIYEAITKSRDFHAMLEHNPDLHDYLRENPKRFNQAYSSLRMVNPTFGKDPLIAGTYMRQIVNSPEAAGTYLTEAMDHAGKGQSPMLDAFGRGALEGAKSGLK